MRCIALLLLGVLLSLSARAADPPADPSIKLASTIIFTDRGVKSTLDFYQTAFGLKIKYYTDSPQFGQFGELETGSGMTIMVASYSAREYMVGDKVPRSPLKQPVDVEFGLFTTDVPKAYERALAAGAKSVAAPRKLPWGQVAAYVTSIEGTLVSLLTPPPFN
jgi:lactoylglutathione lyase